MYRIRQSPVVGAYGRPAQEPVDTDRHKISRRRCSCNSNEIAQRPEAALQPRGFTPE
jgi:hypothetical protein